MQASTSCDRADTQMGQRPWTGMAEEGGSCCVVLLVQARGELPSTRQREHDGLPPGRRQAYEQHGGPDGSLSCKSCAQDVSAIVRSRKTTVAEVTQHHRARSRRLELRCWKVANMSGTPSPERKLTQANTENTKQLFSGVTKQKKTANIKFGSARLPRQVQVDCNTRDARLRATLLGLARTELNEENGTSALRLRHRSNKKRRHFVRGTAVGSVFDGNF